jgi:hypothetical protein
VLLLPIDSPTSAVNIEDKPIQSTTDRSLRLTAETAEIDGDTVSLAGGERKHLVWLGGRRDGIGWPVEIAAAGIYTVKLTYALAESRYRRRVQIDDGTEELSPPLEEVISTSSRIEVQVGDKTLTADIRAGKSWEEYVTREVGEVSIPKPCELQVKLNSETPGGAVVLHLRSVELVPAPSILPH